MYMPAGRLDDVSQPLHILEARATLPVCAHFQGEETSWRFPDSSLVFRQFRPQKMHITVKTNMWCHCVFDLFFNVDEK